MADQTNHRLYRQDGYREMSSGTPAPAANDPLAELARLIGNDSFADRTPRNDPAPQSAQEWNAPQAPAAQYQQPQAAQNYQTDARYAQPAPVPGYPSAYAQPQMPSGYPQQPAYDTSAYEQVAAQQNYAPPPPRQPAAPMGYPSYPDDQNYGAAPAAPGYTDPYATPQNFPPIPQQPLRQPPPFLAEQSEFPPAGYDQGGMPLDDDYDDAIIKRRRMILMAGAAAALIVVGTAGAFGYRALFGSSSSGPPPVIRADASPTKIVAQPARDNAANKSIQDRIGDQINEKLVPREEQPADVRPQPRVVFPGPTANPNAQSGGSAGTVAAEPKRIRTVAIRPDAGSDAGPPPRAAEAQASPPPAAPSRSAAPAPYVAPAPQAAPAPTPQAYVPPPARQTASANGPLSLSPDAAPSAPAARAPAPPRQPQPQPQVASAVQPGAYVQVSSQRSEGDAQASFRALQARYPSVLGNQVATIYRADLGDKGTYYRAMIGPLGGPEAVELCTNLKAAGGSCVIQKP